MVDPDNAALASGTIQARAEDPANARALAARVLQTVCDDKQARDDERGEHEAPRRAPTMWR